MKFNIVPFLLWIFLAISTLTSAAGYQLATNVHYWSVNEYIAQDTYIVSPSNSYFAIVQHDGNCCLYRGSSPFNNIGFVSCLNSQMGAGTYDAHLTEYGIFEVNNENYPNFPYLNYAGLQNSPNYNLKLQINETTAKWGVYNNNNNNQGTWYYF